MGRLSAPGQLDEPRARDPPRVRARGARRSGGRRCGAGSASGTRIAGSSVAHVDARADCAHEQRRMARRASSTGAPGAPSQARSCVVVGGARRETSRLVARAPVLEHVARSAPRAPRASGPTAGRRRARGAASRRTARARASRSGRAPRTRSPAARRPRSPAARRGRLPAASSTAVDVGDLVAPASSARRPVRHARAAAVEEDHAARTRPGAPRTAAAPGSSRSPRCAR